MGAPIKNGWLLVENPIYKWMMTGGTPIYGNLHIITLLYSILYKLIQKAAHSVQPLQKTQLSRCR